MKRKFEVVSHVVYENIMKNKKARGIDIQIREGAKSH